MTIATFKWTILDDVAIAASGSGSMPEEEWKKFVMLLREGKVSRYLQYGVGDTSLTSVQRKLGIEAVSEKKLKVVMVTESAIVRGVVTAASWFGVKVSSFPPSRLQDAVKDLGVPDHRIDAIVKATTALAAGMK